MSFHILRTELAAVAHEPVSTHPSPSLSMNLEVMENVGRGEGAQKA